MRKLLSHAFSQRSLTEQESLVSTAVDRFIEVIGKIGAGQEGLDITKWFNIMTFDIIGDLAFGETFRGLESGEYKCLSARSSTCSKDVGETHPWIQRITGAMTQGALADCFKRFPWLAAISLKCMPGTIRKVIADTKINEEYSINLVKRRIAKKTDRNDFLTRILENRSSEISDIQIAAHASDFVLAGSETTATALSCITYYLLKTPHANKTLLEEVRGRFTTYDEINAASTAQLQYLNATALEGMRIYPPLPIALPRVVPEGGDTVAGHFLPGGVRKRRGRG